MANPKTTKLRLLFERADREAKAAKEKRDKAWLEYLRAMRAEGLCANCEKPLAECVCVLMAGPMCIDFGNRLERVDRAADGAITVTKVAGMSDHSVDDRVLPQHDAIYHEVVTLKCPFPGCHNELEVSWHQLEPGTVHECKCGYRWRIRGRVSR